MNKIEANLQTIIDAINYAESEENANYVITKQDKVLLYEALEVVKKLTIPDVSNCKTEPKLSKLETELGKLEKVHGKIVKYFDVHSACDSFKFEDGAVYRVKLKRSFGKATLD